jgi:hypothetical protein
VARRSAYSAFKFTHTSRINQSDTSVPFLLRIKAVPTDVAFRESILSKEMIARRRSLRGAVLVNRKTRGSHTGADHLFSRFLPNELFIASRAPDGMGVACPIRLLATRRGDRTIGYDL